jgi:hypothetical protein
MTSVFAEDKLTFGVHPPKMFDMALNKFRSIYSKTDSKAIGKHAS